MVDAEELGITHQNLEEMLKSNAPDARRLLGVEGQFGQSLGLTNDWAYRIIRAVGITAKASSAISELATEDCARTERLVDQGRAAIWASRALTSPTARKYSPNDGHLDAGGAASCRASVIADAVGA
jgi:hypothetical protein